MWEQGWVGKVQLVLGEKEKKKRGYWALVERRMGDLFVLSHRRVQIVEASEVQGLVGLHRYFQSQMAWVAQGR